MRELKEYRTNLINRLVVAAHEFQAACLAGQNIYTPLEEDGWNIHQVAAHTRDVDKQVYGWRVRKTAEESNPEFQNFDGQAYMAKNYTREEPLKDILDEFVAQIESLAEMLRKLPPEMWARESSHIMLGRGITLQTWVEKDLAHIEEHLKTVRK